MLGDRLLHHERIQKFRKTSNVKHVYKNGLEKACFTQDGTNSGGEDLAKRTFSDKIFKNSAYEIAINPKYDGFERQLASMVYKFFDKKTGSEEKVTNKAGATVNEDLGQELHKPVIKNLNEEESMPNLAMILGRKWNHNLLRIDVFNIYHVIDTFINMLWSHLLKN